MAAILRKMMERASDPPSLRPTAVWPEWFSKRARTADTPMGAFEGIPLEVVMQILKLLGPEGIMTMILVSKSWKPLVADHDLWIFFIENYHSLLFSETHLRLGFPLQRSLVGVPQLNLMAIYGQRTQVPASLILDAGSGYCKFGWSKNDYPSGRSYSFTEFDDIESPTPPRLRIFFTTVYRRMQAYPESQPIVLTIPLWHSKTKAVRQRLEETVLSVLFEMKVPAVCALNQATLALYAARQISGIAVNIGHTVTSIVPVINGKIMDEFVEVISIGSLSLVQFWEKLLERNNIHDLPEKAAQTLMERLCYIAADYDAELQKDTKASYTVGAEGRFTLSKERFQLGELLFNPRLRYMFRHARPKWLKMMSLDQAVAKCMNRCQASAENNDDSSWFKTIVLCGGIASLPGLAHRLERELHRHLSPSIANGIKVIPPPYGTDTAWVGAKLISNLSTFPRSWCVTRDQFQPKLRPNGKVNRN